MSNLVFEVTLSDGLLAGRFLTQFSAAAAANRAALRG